MNNFGVLPCVGMALDPIHVGTGGSRLGRVDNTIVRDPVTRIPKIPGSSLAGVTRAYAAMQDDEEADKICSEKRVDKEGKTRKKYPYCAGQGQIKKDGSGGHCGKPDCPICTVFGFASKSGGGGFAGLAAFSDIHVLLFPVATYLGAMWVTAPSALRQIKILCDYDFDDYNFPVDSDQNTAYWIEKEQPSQINLGWLMLPAQKLPENSTKVQEEGKSKKNGLKQAFSTLQIPAYIIKNSILISDKLFTHVINSNLEVRTSVSINPATGAAEEGALFTYEALPRGTILYWEVTAKNPQHFKIGDQEVKAVKNTGDVHEIVKKADSYLEALGIGGNNTRGMGRIRVLTSSLGSADNAKS
jgi:CRISPR-associated protein Cmr4